MLRRNTAGQGEKMAVDPVCGMTVDEKTAAGRSIYLGQSYYFCSTYCLQEFEADPAKHVHAGTAPHAHTAPATIEGKAKDPICGMVIDKSGALTTERAGRTYYFCSTGCKLTFDSPERELKSMSTRVAGALSGVLVLAVMRAAVLL